MRCEIQALAVISTTTTDNTCASYLLVRSCTTCHRLAMPSASSTSTAHRVLYVDHQGATVRCMGPRLAVDIPTTAGKLCSQSMPWRDLSRVVLVGGVQCTTQTQARLMKQGIDCVYLSTRGRLKGRLVPAHHPQIERRRAQYAASLDTNRCLPIARGLVEAKVANMRTLLQRHRRTHATKELGRVIDALDTYSDRIAAASSLGTLRGLEGSAARWYFQGFGHCIRRSDPAFAFSRRSRRPPGDAVNALLGFMYALLKSEVWSATATAGLDPYIGLYHQPRAYTPALVLDLMEPFRPVVADAAVLSLLNRRVIQPTHVEARNGGVYLNEAGRKACYRAMSKRRDTTIRHPRLQISLPYHRILHAEAMHLADVLAGDTTDFVPFYIR